MYQRLAIAASRAPFSLLNVRYGRIDSSSCTNQEITWSAARKNMDASATMMSTMMVEISVSCRDGQVTLLTSCRTSLKNFKGLATAIGEIFPAADSAKSQQPRESPRAAAGGYVIGRLRHCKHDLTGPVADAASVSAV
jgi:hypothetical protein